MMPSGTGKAFELPSFFYHEFLSTKGPNRYQKVVTSGCEVITSSPKKNARKGNIYILAQTLNWKTSIRYSEPSINNT